LIIAIPFFAVIAALLIALGVGARRLASQRRDGLEPWVLRLGAAVLGVAVITTAIGVYLDHRVVDGSPKHPVLLDERIPTYRGVRLGMSVDRLEHILGRPKRQGPHPESDESGPSSFPVWRELHYDQLVVFVARERVKGFFTTAADAETRARVGVGDSLTIASRMYANLDCFGVIVGSDASNPDYLACDGLLPSRSVIWFGGDPIDSIWVTVNGGADHVDPPPITRR
jgi:hypothetical protein